MLVTGHLPLVTVLTPFCNQDCGDKRLRSHLYEAPDEGHFRLSWPLGRRPVLDLPEALRESFLGI